MKRFIRAIYRLRYGVRGAIKPPMNWHRANSPAYRWRYRMWKIEEAVYQWTGLPAEWWDAVKGEVAPAMRAHLNREDWPL